MVLNGKMEAILREVVSQMIAEGLLEDDEDKGDVDKLPQYPKEKQIKESL